MLKSVFWIGDDEDEDEEEDEDDNEGKNGADEQKELEIEKSPEAAENDENGVPDEEEKEDKEVRGFSRSIQIHFNLGLYWLLILEQLRICFTFNEQRKETFIKMNFLNLN